MTSPPSPGDVSAQALSVGGHFLFLSFSLSCFLYLSHLVLPFSIPPPSLSLFFSAPSLSPCSPLLNLSSLSLILSLLPLSHPILTFSPPFLSPYHHPLFSPYPHSLFSFSLSSLPISSPYPLSLFSLPSLSLLSLTLSLLFLCHPHAV